VWQQRQLAKQTGKYFLVIIGTGTDINYILRVELIENENERLGLTAGS
jgi:hypothetical protein